MRVPARDPRSAVVQIGGREQAEEVSGMATSVMPAAQYRTQVWLTTESELADLSDRTNSQLATIEGAGGRIGRIEILPTLVSPNAMLYTAVVIYQEPLLIEEE
jgi:hypothetical protein